MTAPALPPDAALLEAGTSALAVDVAGRVVRLRLAGREWLAAGGLDEPLPAGVAAGVTERAAAPGGAAAAVTRWAGDGQPSALERTLTVRPDGSVRADYVRTATDAPDALGPDGRPAVGWAGRAHLPLAPETRLDLPVAARVRVQDERGVALGGPGAEHRWPVLRVGARDATPFGPREVDFTFPALAPQRFAEGGARGYACALVVELPRPAGSVVRVGVEQAGARLELAVDPAEVPHVAVWIDHGAGTLALAAVPAAADPAGGARRWAVTWRGRAAAVGA